MAAVFIWAILFSDSPLLAENSLLAHQVKGPLINCGQTLGLLHIDSSLMAGFTLLVVYSKRAFNLYVTGD